MMFMAWKKTISVLLAAAVLMAALVMAACGKPAAQDIFETITPEDRADSSLYGTGEESGTGNDAVGDLAGDPGSADSGAPEAEAAGTAESAGETESGPASESSETPEDTEGFSIPEKAKYASSSMPEYVCGAWVAGVGEYADYPSVRTADAASLRADCDKLLEEAQNMGINVLFFHVRPSSDAFYPSQYYPWSRYLTGVQGLPPGDGFDPLAYMTEHAHERGIQLHAWINPYRIRTDNVDGSGIASIPIDALINGNPALMALRTCILPCSDGFYYLDPAEPAVREMVVNGALEIARNYNVDGIHMDDYFYPSAGIDDSVSYAKYGGGMDINNWRRENVNALVRELDKRIHEVRPGLAFGISPSGIWANKSQSNPSGSATRGMEARNQLYADSVTWIKNGWIDYIIPQIYWEIGKEIADYSVLVPWWCSQVEGTDVRLYIGMGDYRSMLARKNKDTGSVWYGADELKRQVKLNDGHHAVSGEVHFNFMSISRDPALSGMYSDRYGGS